MVYLVSLSGPIPGTLKGVSSYSHPVQERSLWYTSIVCFQVPVLSYMMESVFPSLWHFGCFSKNSPLCCTLSQVESKEQLRGQHILVLQYLCVWGREGRREEREELPDPFMWWNSCSCTFLPSQPIYQYGESSSWKVWTPNSILVRSSGSLSPGKCTGSLLSRNK